MTVAERTLPRYPVYVPSKGRFESGYTPKCLIRDGVPFYLVVEPQELDAYSSRYPEARYLVLPWSGDDEARRSYCRGKGIENGGLIAVRNWIRDHAEAAGHERHWQLDDNIKCFFRRWKAQRLHCRAGIGLAVCEDFTDRYENVGVSGLNYAMFAPEGQKFPPFYLNVHVYSCSLINHAIPYRWRLRYNDDTDICLQALSGGWCTILVNAFVAQKKWTMTVGGGNTADLYQGDGRLRMARDLERVWPGVVETKRRFRRPQHVVKDQWRKFDTPLRLKPGIDLGSLGPNEYGMELRQVKPIKSKALRELVRDKLAEGPTAAADQD